MKMLKKAAAVLLAAAMSLTMLTACGGGSGSTSTKLAGILGGGKVLIDIENDEGRLVEATNSKKTYIKQTGKKTNKTLQVWYHEDATYLLFSNGEAYKQKAQHDNVEFVMPSAEEIKQITTGTYKVNDVEYYAETFTEKNESLIVCFSGNKPVYLVIKDAEGEEVWKVNALTSSFNEVDYLDPPADVKFVDMTQATQPQQ